MEKKINIQDIKDVIEKLSLISSVANNLKNMEFDPFVPLPEELTKLTSDLEVILNSYLDTLHELHTTQQVLLELEDTYTALDASARRSGKNAPAYKHSIDEDLIYRLWKKDVPVREIARQAGCSPNTVKSRVFSIEHGGKDH